MLTDFSRSIKILVSDVGQIGAGTTVEFLPSMRKVKITRPSAARATDDLVSARVCGDSLVGDGIFDGDRVTCRLNFELAEVRDGRLVVARLPCGALVLKHIHFVDDGQTLRVRLVSANPDYEDLEYEFGEVDVRAVVIESVRSWE
jgi:SOS-response transcriptional repressor LexA